MGGADRVCGVDSCGERPYFELAACEEKYNIGPGDLDASFSSRNDLFRKLACKYATAESIYKGVGSVRESCCIKEWRDCGGVLDRVR